MRPLLLIVTLFALVQFYGCAWIWPIDQGEDFPVEKALYVVKGMPDDEVLRLMDQPPYDRVVHSETTETWVWVYSHDGKTKTFAVTFEENLVTATNILVD